MANSGIVNPAFRGGGSNTGTTATDDDDSSSQNSTDTGAGSDAGGGSTGSRFDNDNTGISNPAFRGGGDNTGTGPNSDDSQNGTDTGAGSDGGSGASPSGPTADIVAASDQDKLLFGGPNAPGTVDVRFSGEGERVVIGGRRVDLVRNLRDGGGDETATTDSTETGAGSDTGPGQGSTPGTDGPPGGIPTAGRDLGLTIGGGGGSGDDRQSGVGANAVVVVGVALGALALFGG